VTDDPRPGPALPPPPPAARPAAAPTAGRGWRTTIAVAVTILVVVIGVNVADASMPLPEDLAAVEDPAIPDASFPVDPGAPAATVTPVERGPVDQDQTLDVGLGYSIRVPAGWSVVSREDEVTVLQKGAALLVVGGIASQDTPEELATWYRDAWFADGGYSGGNLESTVVGDGIPAAHLDYTGVFDGTTIDGRIVAASAAGAGLLVNAFAPTGLLAEVAPDLDSILASVRLGER
jgi:hypothetical protein